jgi:hypothetical protein
MQDGNTLGLERKRDRQREGKGDRTRTRFWVRVSNLFVEFFNVIRSVISKNAKDYLRGTVLECKNGLFQSCYGSCDGRLQKGVIRLDCFAS